MEMLHQSQLKASDMARLLALIAHTVQLYLMTDCPQLIFRRHNNPFTGPGVAYCQAMTANDLSQILLIEKNTANNPWSETQFIDSMSSMEWY